MNPLLNSARQCWMAAAPLRASRRRLKAFAYGRQWGDSLRTPDGRVVSELTRCLEEGRTPVTNNIIRRMVKTIIGQYRHLAAADSASSAASDASPSLSSALSETDARALEEFLISGCAVQRIDSASHTVENVSPERFIFRRFLLSDGADCSLLGQLHDMPLWEVVDRFARSDPHRAASIEALYKHSSASASPLGALSEAASFETPSLPETVRVVEVWHHSVEQFLEVSLESEKPGAPPDVRRVDPARLDELRRTNARRRRKGWPEMQIARRSEHKWTGSWLSPDGVVLHTEEAPRHPFVIRFYPMIDGEVHSAVEDVIDQQKMVNRLVSTLDHTIASSAKGVLLYPADQLPDGFTWQDIRRIWSNPQGILPFRRSSKTVMPYQVHSANVGSGATELLKMQLDLFDRLSGATGALSGRSTSALGEGMLRAEIEYSAISILDLLNSFHSFLRQRNLLLGADKNTPSKQ